MNLSIATDFCGSLKSPQRYLKLIAEAGFTHLHWCHQWCTDFMYSKCELDAVKGWLDEYGLTLLDIHGSEGQEKSWDSTVEYERRAGVELVTNRIEMLRYLGGTGTLMMHIPSLNHTVTPENMPHVLARFDAFRRSMHELEPALRKNNVLIAVENMWNDNWELLNRALDEFPSDILGICYDSGHGNSHEHRQLDDLEKVKSRLQALHLHDNNGEGDQHKPPFYPECNVDWERLAKIIASSSYNREISYEISMGGTPFFDKERAEAKLPQTDEAILAFLKDTHSRCERFAKMVEAEK